VSPATTQITIPVPLTPATSLSTIKVDVAGYSSSAYSKQTQVWDYGKPIRAACAVPSGG
jgi:hypothetical protein